MANVTVYLTTWCPYCAMAVRLLGEKGQEFTAIDVEEAPERRREMVERAGRTSVPQIFVGKRHVGGYDELAALDASGELDTLLASEEGEGR